MFTRHPPKVQAEPPKPVSMETPLQVEAHSLEPVAVTVEESSDQRPPSTTMPCELSPTPVRVPLTVRITLGPTVRSPSKTTPCEELAVPPGEAVPVMEVEPVIVLLSPKKTPWHPTQVSCPLPLPSIVHTSRVLPVKCTPAPGPKTPPVTLHESPAATVAEFKRTPTHSLEQVEFDVLPSIDTEMSEDTSAEVTLTPSVEEVPVPVPVRVTLIGWEGITSATTEIPVRPDPVNIS